VAELTGSLLFFFALFSDFLETSGIGFLQISFHHLFNSAKPLHIDVLYICFIYYVI